MNRVGTTLAGLALLGPLLAAQTPGQQRQGSGT